MFWTGVKTEIKKTNQKTIQRHHKQMNDKMWNMCASLFHCHTDTLTALAIHINARRFSATILKSALHT